MMNIKLLCCGLTLAYGIGAFSQSVELTTRSADLLRKGDSLECKLNLKLMLHDIKPTYLVKLTPVVRNGSEVMSFPKIEIVGEKKKKSILRRMAFAQKRGKVTENSFLAFWKDDNMGLSIDYSRSVAWASWMSGAKLEVKREVYDDKGILMQNVSVDVQAASKGTSVASLPGLELVAKSDMLTKSTDTTQEKFAKEDLKFRGTYCIPPSDEADNINKKELDFSLEEARVLADVNPQILSLSELYTVALSYKNTMDMFYKVIFLSVQLYPADPIANLNAAAAAVEMNMPDKAGQFLQLAPHGTVAYKNCRGVYELMVGNISEGIRMLKDAKASGSEEANQNLTAFFKYHKR